MNALKSIRLPLQAAILCLFGLLLMGCRKASKPERMNIDQLKVEVAPELMGNRLGGVNSVVDQQFKDSPIHWQPWEPEVFERAKAAKRLIFCVVAVPQYPRFNQVMRDIESEPSIVQIINSNYLPVLIDADIAREFELLSVDLAEEIGRPIAFPMFLWLDYEANFVASTPVSLDSPGGVYETFTQSHAMIFPIWEDDLELGMVDGARGYVLTNSAHDQQRRQKRYQAKFDDLQFTDDVKRDIPIALRQLVSNYDPYTQSITNAGETIPTRAIKLLSDASMRSGLSEELRGSSKKVVQGLLDQLLPSPMFDPLDGGAFSLRTAKSWSLPAFVKDGASQAGIADALLMAHQATGDPRALSRALELIELLESKYVNKEGLLVLSPTVDRDPQKWMWTIAEVQDVLGAEEAKWWIRATGMEDLGNLPLEVDATRMFFRKNCIGMKNSLADMAAELGASVQDFEKRYDDAKGKMLAARELRMRTSIKDESPHFRASFTMVSTYARAYQVTGNPDHLRKAQDLLTRCKQAFEVSGVLHACTSAEPSKMTVARAFHYALAMNAALDLHLVSKDGQWDLWADVLLQRFMGQFVEGKLVHECPLAIRLIALPIEDRIMLTEDSTFGLLSIVAARMQALGKALPAGFAEVADGFPAMALKCPVLYGGPLMGALQRQYPQFQSTRK